MKERSELAAITQSARREIDTICVNHRQRDVVIPSAYDMICIALSTFTLRNEYLLNI